MNSQTCIVIDGGTNGEIQATANGDALANQVASNVVGNTGRAGNHQTVQNLTIHNVFIKVQNNTSTADDSQGINLFGGNALLTHNTLDHMSTGMGSGDGSNIEMSFNTFSAINHAITYGCASSGCGGGINNVKVHDNVFQGGNQIYDESGDGYHRNDAIFQTSGGSSSLGTCFTNLQYYNNYGYGMMSVLGQTTSRLFLDDETGSCHINAYVFNNTFSLASGDGGVSNGFIDSPIGGAQIYNNSFITPYTSGGAGNCFSGWDVSTTIAKNNLAIGCNGAYYPNDPGSGGGMVFDFNMYNQVSNAPWTIPNSVPQCNLGNCAFSTFSQWQGYGLDAHSDNNTDPGVINITNCSTGSLSACKLASSSSNAHSFGTNLTSLGITGLSTDAAGNSRPSVGNWDAGAFQLVSGCSFTPVGLGPWTVGQVISVTFTTSGCTTSSWSTSGTFPSGITFNTGTGVLSGTVGSNTGSPFTPSITYSTFTENYSITVNASPSITTSSPLPSGTQGTSYSTTLSSTGGTGTVTFSITSGSLTGSGLTLSSAGAITGTAGTPGVYNFSVTPTDANNVAGAPTAFSLTISSSSPTGGTMVGGKVVVNGKAIVH